MALQIQPHLSTSTTQVTSYFQEHGAQISSIKGSIAEVAAMGMCSGGGALIASYALVGVSPITGALIGGSAALISLVTRSAFKNIFGSTETQSKIGKTVIESLQTFVAATTLEAGLCSLFLYNISPLGGAILGASSAVIDTIINLAVSVLHGKNPWLKLCYKITFTAFAAIAMVSTLGLSTGMSAVAFAQIFTVRLVTKLILFQIIMRLASIPPPEDFMAARKPNTWSNVLNDEGEFKLRNFMWVAAIVDSSKP